MENNLNSDATGDSPPNEVLTADSASKSKRDLSGAGRFDARRSPTTGHRTRRNKTPDSQLSINRFEDDNANVKSISRQGNIRENARRVSVSDDDDDEEKENNWASRQKTISIHTKRLSNISTESGFDDSDVPKPVLRKRSKSIEKREPNQADDKNNTSWWKSWPNWGQESRKRMKSLERDPPKTTQRKRNRSLERPPALGKKSTKHEDVKEQPVAKKRNKSKTRSKSQDSRRLSVEDSSDDFWKAPDEIRRRNVRKETPETEKDEFKKVETPINEMLQIIEKENAVDEDIKVKNFNKEKRDIKVEEKRSWIFLFIESKKEWKLFIEEYREEVYKIYNLRNRCISSFVIILIYCGLGGMVFKFTEGAFESFYKCGVKRVKRDFVDSLWSGSHHLREEEWKSLARRKLMDFENQLHTAYDAGIMSYSGQRSWSFINSMIYCITVVTTIGYGHISPTTTTGRAITIIYAIFGIPLFLILLADFGKLFTRGIKFIWAFVRRVYYTGSCKKVRRTVPVQEVMKGVQMVYDMATFRRPSQLPPGLEMDANLPPPLPPRVPFTPGDQPGTPAPSNFAIDDEFNLPISVAITILLIYIFCGATVFYVWEEWGFFESFYFVFISMSTIGFGDFVPQNQMYMMASIVYLVFGLALTSMCINVVQEKLSDSFRQASAKIGATIGLRVAEEDGAITPVAPIAVEVAEVHGFKKSPAATPSAS